jgi:molybdate transport system substrate-binding protein
VRRDSLGTVSTLVTLLAAGRRGALARGLAVSAALGVGASVVLTGCTPASGSETLTVLAAASLRGPFTALEATFEDAHPGVDVTISFGGSSDLAHQI